jgi:hypothetical protein
MMGIVIQFLNKKLITVGFVLLLLGMCATGFTYDNLATKISKVGCHVDKTMCYVYVEATTIPNSENCEHSTSIRWSSETFDNSSEVFSLLLTAKVSGAQVYFGNVGGSCYEDFVSFSWVTIQ